jgi:tetratricopeptide (TPR) repeat protein
VAYGLLSLANLHYYQGKYRMAEQEGRRALEIVKNFPKTSYYAAANDVLGLSLNKTGRSKEAERLLREALAIRQKSPRPADRAIVQGDLGECLLTQNRYAEAEPLLVASYRTLGAAHVPQSPVLKQARERVTALYAAWGKNNRIW